jgi:hypothetical protein
MLRYTFTDNIINLAIKQYLICHLDKILELSNIAYIDNK